MTSEPQAIAEWHDIDANVFREEIVPGYRPAVLRGLVKHWPAVEHGMASPESMSRYLARFDSGKEVDTIMAPPQIKGRMFYNDAMTGFNFSRGKASIGAVNEKLVRYTRFEHRPLLAVQSAPMADCLPGFAGENVLPLLEPSIQPRIWLGNAITVPAHFDESSNIACVVSGLRRFTLLPPEQVRNLYVGPLDFAPTGTPISMVHFWQPDFTRFPRFRDALSAAQVAELQPGDALYIPPLWWHHVESLKKYNTLINYWWKTSGGMTTKADSALNCLLHCLLDLRQLPAPQREAWGVIFDHYIFHASDELAQHIPEHKRGLLGKVSPELAQHVRTFLLSQLER